MIDELATVKARKKFCTVNAAITSIYPILVIITNHKRKITLLLYIIKLQQLSAYDDSNRLSPDQEDAQTNYYLMPLYI